MARSFKAHFTRETDNIGQRVMIPNSEDWIQVLGTSSDKFRRAQGELRRKILEYVQTNGEECRKTAEFASFVDNESKLLRRAQIGAWSFEEPVTDENIDLLFKEAPQLEDLVMSNAGKHSKPEQSSPASSESSPNSSSISTDP